MPDAAAVLNTVLTPAAAVRALDALRAAHCLRERPGDFPPAPPGVMILNDVRVTDFMPTDDAMVARLGSTTRYGLHVSRGSTYSDALGLLSLTVDDVHTRRRKELGDDAA